MTAGRRPTPTALRELRGNPGHRPLNRDEPEIEEELIEAPVWLRKGPARDEWNRIVPIMRKARIVNAADLAVVAGYCTAYARWLEAEAHLEKDGLVTKQGEKGYQGQNAYLAIANRALEHMVKFAAELGITPSSRSRVKALPKPTKQNAFTMLPGGRRGKAA